MSIKRRSKYTLSVLLLASFLAIIMGLANVPMAQTSPQISVYKVVGSADLSNPGSASYWNQIPWINISLTANIPMAPTSGLTHYLLVKAAWNGTWIFILEKWYAPEPAFSAWSAALAGVYPYASGPGVNDIIELTPGTKYALESNYTNYVSTINGKEETGRLVFNFSGILLPAPNSTQISVLPNGTILYYGSPRGIEDLLYTDGMFYGYYTNSSWYYPDRTAIMWYVANNVPTKDDMNLGGEQPGEVFDGFTFKYAGGSLAQQGGAANIWMWVSGATWNNATYDPAFKANIWENLTFLNSTSIPYTDPGDHGFAVPLYTNNTNIYEVDTGGIWYTPVASSGLNGSLFFIWTGATYQNGYWTVEFARPLAVPSAYANWMPNITVGKTYYVAFAVWQGKLGETLFDKSITSNFLTLELVTTPPTSTTSSTTPTTSVTNTTSVITVTSIPSATIYVTIVGVVIAIIALIILYVVFRR
ncbi:cytochrome b558/566 subunit A [Saccharolobus islandicus]|uniref:Cytochrome b558/566 subunit A n=1 Tax=Saccharolobus islandicus LAL14/1 TaxID=1241935 RepID=M9UGL9_SACIS|nr:cytochrome b558/566 subunit A [Sulfolobus islandicus]AGJ63786.1 cytochrome b558/566 subunit A (cbsA) [Sulfolobus islandicus LAL14/1]